MPDRDDPSTYGGWSEGRPEVSIVGGPIVESGLSRIQRETIGSSGEKDCEETGLTMRSRDTDVTLGPRAWNTDSHNRCSECKGLRVLSEGPMVGKWEVPLQ